MSRFVDWYVAQQLQNMGWPKTKGIFRKTPYVPAELADMVIQQGLQICMGLGAGRPAKGAQIVADVFANNPWTPESTDSLCVMLARADEEIALHPSELPWNALYIQSRLADYAAEIPWDWLASSEVSMVRAILCAKAAFWGLRHEKAIAEAFFKDKKKYEEIAREAIPHGLAVPAEFPWPTLESFYQTCEDMVADFEGQRPPLASVPPAFSQTPILRSRLGS